jgi:hypothetical protein
MCAVSHAAVAVKVADGTTGRQGELYTVDDDDSDDFGMSVSAPHKDRRRRAVICDGDVHQVLLAAAAAKAAKTTAAIETHPNPGVTRSRSSSTPCTRSGSASAKFNRARSYWDEGPGRDLKRERRLSTGSSSIAATITARMCGVLALHSTVPCSAAEENISEVEIECGNKKEVKNGGTYLSGTSSATQHPTVSMVRGPTTPGSSCAVTVPVSGATMPVGVAESSAFFGLPTIIPSLSEVKVAQVSAGGMVRLSLTNVCFIARLHCQWFPITRSVVKS